MAAAVLRSAIMASSSCSLKTHSTIQSFRGSMRRTLENSVKVGFVPTMGALHDGHLSLVRKARCENDVVVCSIFVNPTQFGPNEDLDRYPRRLQQDRERLSQLGVDHLFAPNANDMYEKNHLMYIDPVGFDDIPEGRNRPGHFRGVATIVAKLFNIVRPTVAYFGQKDAAQCVLIKRLVRDLNMDIDIRVEPTVREPHGLAMSSRNAYLTEEQRTAAGILYKALQAARDVFVVFQQSSEQPIPASTLEDVVRATLRTEPAVSEIQYVSVDCKESMRPLQTVDKETGAIVSLACKIGSVRLIDNIVL